MKENAAPLSVPAPAPARPERQAAPPPAPSSAVESPASNSNTANTVDSRSIPEAEGFIITFLKSLCKIKHVFSVFVMFYLSLQLMGTQFT